MNMDTEDAFADEIADIFVEEVDDVLKQMDRHIPSWNSNAKDVPALKEIRRAFHTLKGSGRMVQADQIGELAWAVENMLNRVLDGTLPDHPLMHELVEQVRQVIPVLLQAFRNRQAAALAGVNIHLLIDQANALREGREVQSLNGFERPAMMSAELQDEVPVALQGFTTAELDAANEHIAALMNQVDDMKRDWLAVNTRLDALKTTVTELGNNSAADEINRHLQQSDREIKELKYFIKATSEEVLAGAVDTQQRLTVRVDQELRVIRDVLAQIKSDHKTERDVIRTEMTNMVKLWSLGCSITFSVFVLLAVILL